MRCELFRPGNSAQAWVTLFDPTVASWTPGGTLQGQLNANKVSAELRHVLGLDGPQESGGPIRLPLPSL